MQVSAVRVGLLGDPAQLKAAYDKLLLEKVKVALDAGEMKVRALLVLYHQAREGRIGTTVRALHRSPRAVFLSRDASGWVPLSLDIVHNLSRPV